MKEGRGGDQLQLLAASKVITLISCYQIGLDGYKTKETEGDGETHGAYSPFSFTVNGSDAQTWCIMTRLAV